MSAILILNPKPKLKLLIILSVITLNYVEYNKVTLIYLIYSSKANIFDCLANSYLQSKLNKNGKPHASTSVVPKICAIVLINAENQVINSNIMNVTYGFETNSSISMVTSSIVISFLQYILLI